MVSAAARGEGSPLAGRAGGRPTSGARPPPGQSCWRRAHPRLRVARGGPENFARGWEVGRGAGSAAAGGRAGGRGRVRCSAGGAGALSLFLCPLYGSAPSSLPPPPVSTCATSGRSRSGPRVCGRSAALREAPGRAGGGRGRREGGSSRDSTGRAPSCRGALFRGRPQPWLVLPPSSRRCCCCPGERECSWRWDQSGAGAEAAGGGSCASPLLSSHLGGAAGVDGAGPACALGLWSCGAGVALGLRGGGEASPGRQGGGALRGRVPGCVRVGSGEASRPSTAAGHRWWCPPRLPLGAGTSGQAAGQPRPAPSSRGQAWAPSRPLPRCPAQGGPAATSGFRNCRHAALGTDPKLGGSRALLPSSPCKEVPGLRSYPGGAPHIPAHRKQRGPLRIGHAGLRP